VTVIVICSAGFVEIWLESAGSGVGAGPSGTTTVTSSTIPS
jgi:hypothetical protein